MSDENKHKKVRVLIVDDSLFMRQLIARMLDSFSDIEIVDTAKNGQDALKKIAEFKPDVVTLDLAMKGWSGLTTLRKIMKEYPTPTIILSAYSKEDADITLECLDAGAISFILKPSGEMSLDIEVVKDQLIGEIRAASKVDVRKIESLAIRTSEVPRYQRATTDKIIVIGASTGGLQTLEVILSGIPADFPVPIVVVQHMPAIAFTESVVKRFKRICSLMVKIAEDGESIHHGTVYVAPGGHNLRLKRENGDPEDITISLEENNHNETGMVTPSIDQVMESAASIYGKDVLGIILTGMGNDGVLGMKSIKNSEGRTVVQDESSLIFGMPKEVIDAGFADKVLPLNGIVKEIINFCR